MTVAEFHGRFATQEACAEHLRKVRWGEKLERFDCPAYRANRQWMEDRLFDRLLVAAVGAKPLTCKQLVAGDR